MAADYDNLSPLGADQCRALGRYWTRQEVTIDALFVGPLRRHRQSLDAFVGEYGGTLPPIIELDELSEYGAFELLKRAVPRLAQGDPKIADLVGQMQDPGPVGARARELLFQRVTRAWVRGQVVDDEVESFPAFRERVSRGIDKLIAGSVPGRRVVSFTSAGAVAAAAGRALELADPAVLELSFVLRNGSVSECLFSSAGRFSLLSLNQIEHLSSELVTFR